MEILPMVSTELAEGAGCTLDADGLRERVSEWRMLRDRATRIDRDADGARIEFDRTVTVATLERLVELESACCPFYRFTIDADPSGARLTIDAGPGNGEAVAALLGIG